jgi:hypothetical protein
MDAGTHGPRPGSVDGAQHPTAPSTPPILTRGSGAPVQPLRAATAETDLRMVAEAGQVRLLKGVPAAPAGGLLRLLVFDCRPSP